MPPKKGRTIISANTSDAMLHELDAIAKNDGITRSVLINELLAMALPVRKQHMRPKLPVLNTSNTEINS